MKRLVYGFLHDRLGLDDLQYLAAKKQVPVHRCTPFYFLGGMALFLFSVQIVTGILLSLFYKPSPDQAFESVRAIMTEVDFGWLIRSAHSWSANLLVGVLFLHLLTTYMMRAYRQPREIQLDERRAAAGDVLCVRIQRLLAAVERIGIFRHPRGNGDHRCRPGDWPPIAPLGSRWRGRDGGHAGEVLLLACGGPSPGDVRDCWVATCT